MAEPSLLVPLELHAPLDEKTGKDELYTPLLTDLLCRDKDEETAWGRKGGQNLSLLAGSPKQLGLDTVPERPVQLQLCHFGPNVLTDKRLSNHSTNHASVHSSLSEVVVKSHQLQLDN